MGSSRQIFFVSRQICVTPRQIFVAPRQIFVAYIYIYIYIRVFFCFKASGVIIFIFFTKQKRLILCEYQLNRLRKCFLFLFKVTEELRSDRGAATSSD